MMFTTFNQAIQLNIMWLLIGIIPHMIRQPLRRAYTTALVALMIVGVGMIEGLRISIWIYIGFLVCTAGMLYTGLALTRLPKKWGRRNWSLERTLLCCCIGWPSYHFLRTIHQAHDAGHTTTIQMFGVTLICCGFVALFARRSIFAWLTTLYLIVCGCVGLGLSDWAINFMLMSVLLGFSGVVFTQKAFGRQDFSSYTFGYRGE